MKQKYKCGKCGKEGKKLIRVKGFLKPYCQKHADQLIAKRRKKYGS